mgnify:CR=1 FL=1
MARILMKHSLIEFKTIGADHKFKLSTVLMNQYADYMFRES